MITREEAQCARIDELLLDVRKDARTILKGVLGNLEIDLDLEGLPTPEERTLNEVRAFAGEQRAQPKLRFEKAFWLITDGHETYASDLHDQDKQWAFVEKHIGWRHAHRATLNAVAEVIEDIKATHAAPPWSLKAEDFKRLRLATNWLGGMRSTRDFLKDYEMGTRPRPQIWRSTSLPLEDTPRDVRASSAVRGERDKQGAGKRRTPDGKSRQEKDLASSLVQYEAGYSLGMKDLAAEVDRLIVDAAGARQHGFEAVMNELVQRCDGLRENYASNWTNGDEAAKQRDLSRKAVRRSNDAARLAGMALEAWTEAMKGEAGEALVRRLSTPGPLLAALLAEDFAGVKERYAGTVEPEVEAARMEAELQHVQATTFDPETVGTSGGRDLGGHSFSAM
jgi:hypothetical protein